jgi:hypothetical protein
VWRPLSPFPFIYPANKSLVCECARVVFVTKSVCRASERVNMRVCVCARGARVSLNVFASVGCRSNASKVIICTSVLVSKSGFEGEGPPLQQLTHVHDARVSIPRYIKPTAMYIANSNTDSQKTSNKETRYQPKRRGSRNLGRSERPQKTSKTEDALSVSVSRL